MATLAMRRQQSDPIAGEIRQDSAGRTSEGGRNDPADAMELAGDLVDQIVSVHRGRVMRKMEARSLAQLVEMAARLGQPIAGGRLIQT